MKVRINRILRKTSVEGPGIRYCIWVQGCILSCAGCYSEHTWDLLGGVETDTETIVSDIMQTKGIEGVTFLGGEPFLQAKALSEIAKICRLKGLSVLTFSGYTYDEILHTCTTDFSWKELLEQTDLLIDGPFIKSDFSIKRPWIGSSNQSYRFLTKRYKYLEDKLDSYTNQVEITIKENGTILVNGMGDFNKLKNIIKSLGD